MFAFENVGQDGMQLSCQSQGLPTATKVTDISAFRDVSLQRSVLWSQIPGGSFTERCRSAVALAAGGRPADATQQE